MIGNADNGKVIKAVRTENQPVVIEEIQVFSVSVPVTNLKIHRGTERQPAQARLIVSSLGEIVALKLQRCYSDKVTSCRYSSSHSSFFSTSFPPPFHLLSTSSSCIFIFKFF